MVAGAVRAESREAVDVGSDEADIARAALQRIERRHFGEAEVALARRRTLAIGRPRRLEALGGRTGIAVLDQGDLDPPVDAVAGPLAVG